MKRPRGAIAVDLGATSARFAAGEVRDGRIAYEIVQQKPHHTTERDGRLVWDLSALQNLCLEALDYGKEQFDEATLGIDAWGVDHGFLGTQGELLQPVSCYRDPIHADVFERFASHREWLYTKTGVQHQPFNTLYQLIARREADPTLPTRARWMMIPEMLLHLLGGEGTHESTHASTTQLTGLDGRWLPEAFELAGWPLPDSEPQPPGGLAGRSGSVEFVHVAEHDSASAVCGMGPLNDYQAFLNIGTWSLFGVVMDTPLVSSAAAKGNFTNERTADGRVRFLKNIPGFWVVNRLHEELAISRSVPEWLAAGAQNTRYHVDLLKPDYFNPNSMSALVARELGMTPTSEDEWAGVALSSLVESTLTSIAEIEAATGRTIRSIRSAGGGSQSEAFCQALADRTGRPIHAGPAEATVLGNLAMQFFAKGVVRGFDELNELVLNSIRLREYAPKRLDLD